MMLAALILAAAAGAAAPGPTPEAKPVVDGVWWIPGGMLPNRQPDGNTVVLDAPDGLIVVDTGRLAWHRDAILSLASRQQKKIIAIVNTHWHLDHVSGNPALRAAYPGLRVYASDAIDGALAGFLKSSAADSAHYLADPALAAELREDISGDLATIGNGAALRSPFPAMVRHSVMHKCSAITMRSWRFSSARVPRVPSSNARCNGWTMYGRCSAIPCARHNPRLGAAGYYVGLLRANGGRSKYCEALPSSN